MTELAATIAHRIRREGPLSIAAFMAIALHDREAGYYARHDPLGSAGDFITAPEISQIFGALIGLWSAASCRNSGRPDPCAEHLADLRGRDEIGGAAERVVPRVIAGLAVMQRDCHEGGDRERPL